MIQQTVREPKLKIWQAIIVIAVIIGAMYVAAQCSNWLRETTGLAMSSNVLYVIIIGCGVVELQKHLSEYHYTLQDGTLYFEKTFGKRSRIAAKVSGEMIVEIGEKDELALKYRGKIRGSVNCSMPNCQIPQKMLVYRDGVALSAVLFQPDGELREALGLPNH